MLLSDPPGARVYIPMELRPEHAEKLLGVADGRTIHLDGSEFLEAARYRLIYRLDGYRDRTVELASQQTVRLQPATWPAWTHEAAIHHGPLLGALVLLLAVCLLQWRRQRRVSAALLASARRRVADVYPSVGHPAVGHEADDEPTQLRPAP
jgi:hypothetical protein